MKETIILAPGANGSELLRTLAKNGANTLGVRVTGGTELARTALMRSGKTVEQGFLTAGQAPSLIYSLLGSVEYFKAASFSDAEQLYSALYTMRMLAGEDEAQCIEEALSEAEFQDKNDALLEVYRQYTAMLKSNDLVDGAGLIRLALAESSAFDADFLCLKEYPLLPLEKALLEHVSGGKYDCISILDLFTGPKKEARKTKYFKAYGSINEAEHIISEIYKNGIPLDQCVVACAAPGAYSQYFYDISCRCGIPVTYGSGVPIENSNPARLLKLLHLWDTTGFHGVDALKAVILSDSFSRDRLAEALGLKDGLKRKDIDHLVSTAGQLRLSFDAAANTALIEGLKTTSVKPEYIDLTEKFAAELAPGMSAFIEKYSVIRPDPSGRIDRSALNVITSAVDACMQYASDKLDEIIPRLLSKTVCSESSRPGCLHVTSIPGARTGIRENLYICGMSAANFPGTPTENYLLLDNDLLKFSASGAALTSSGRIRGKKNSLENLLALAKHLGSNVSLSYPYYDLAVLKAQNPSSVLYEIYEAENPKSTIDDSKKAFESTTYFTNGLSASDLAGKAYADGDVPAHITFLGVDEAPQGILDREWSPSALEMFFQCPRRFYLNRILGIPEEEEDDPFEVINAKELGTLAHSMMEELARKRVSEEEFLAACSDAFDAFLKQRPAMHSPDAQRKKQEFLDMMKRSYEMDPGNKVLSAEDKYHCQHPSGVKLMGYPDRVEKTPTGLFMIADYKTGRKKNHVENDIRTCLQVVIYAWMCRQAGIPVSLCVYRYIRKGITVKCVYDNDMEEKLDAMLRAFADATVSGEFPAYKSQDNCKYCKLKDICETMPGQVSEAADE
ncbi:MAG: PD-(D/E)XK nuclease family protein [Firmicutes bacterium]|nr:PD-(D/E)XK nuclease family protein [Bacillota bacterium]